MHLQGDLSHTGVPMKLCRPMYFLSHPLVFPCLSGREVFQNSPSISLKELRGVLRSSGILRSWTSWPLKMGSIDCLETSVQNYHSTLRNIPAEHRSHLQCGGSLKSRIRRGLSKASHPPPRVGFKPGSSECEELGISRTIPGYVKQEWAKVSQSLGRSSFPDMLILSFKTHWFEDASSEWESSPVWCVVMQHGGMQTFWRSVFRQPAPVTRLGSRFISNAECQAGCQGSNVVFEQFHVTMTSKRQYRGWAPARYNFLHTLRMLDACLYIILINDIT
jgi:hypothetical protein